MEDEKYITVSLNQVQNIKYHSKKMMEFYKHRITKLLQSNDLIHVSINAKSLVDKVSKELRNECIALFNYVYSLYLQVMLLGNFNESYLHKILDDIDRAMKNYERLYKQIDQYLEKYTKDSFDHQLMNGLADAHKFAGDVINKVPVLGDTPIQYVIKDTGKNIKLFNKKEHHQIVKEFQQYKDISVKPFVKSLEKVDAICNKPITLLIAEDKIYFKNRG